MLRQILSGKKDFNTITQERSKVFSYTMRKKTTFWRSQGKAFRSKNIVPTFEHGSSRMMLRVYFTATSTGPLQKVNGMMTKD